METAVPVPILFFTLSTVLILICFCELIQCCYLTFQKITNNSRVHVDTNDNTVVVIIQNDDVTGETEDSITGETGETEPPCYNEVV